MIGHYEAHEQGALAKLRGGPVSALLERLLTDTDRSLRVLKDPVEVHRAQGRALLLEDLLHSIVRFSQGDHL